MGEDQRVVAQSVEEGLDDVHLAEEVAMVIAELVVVVIEDAEEALLRGGRARGETIEGVGVGLGHLVDLRRWATSLRAAVRRFWLSSISPRSLAM
jgi:hypothetical protein